MCFHASYMRDVLKCDEEEIKRFNESQARADPPSKKTTTFYPGWGELVNFSKEEVIIN